MARGEKIKAAIREASTSGSPTSSKRVVTLIITAHFILSSFLVLFLAAFVIFYLPKGKVEPELLYLLRDILEYDFYIIISGLGFIATESVSSILIARFSSKITTNTAQSTEEVKDT